MKNKKVTVLLKAIVIAALMIGYMAISNQEFEEQAKGKTNDNYITS